MSPDHENLKVHIYTYIEGINFFFFLNVVLFKGSIGNDL